MWQKRKYSPTRSIIHPSCCAMGHITCIVNQKKKKRVILPAHVSVAAWLQTMTMPWIHFDVSSTRQLMPFPFSPVTTNENIYTCKHVCRPTQLHQYVARLSGSSHVESSKWVIASPILFFFFRSKSSSITLG